MSKSLVPEAHDVGKLVDNEAVVKDGFEFRRAGAELHGHALDWVDWENPKWEEGNLAGLKDNPNFQIIRVHHVDGYDKLPESGTLPADVLFRKQVILLKVADHYASTFSRSVAESSEHNAKFEALGKVLSDGKTVERIRKILWRLKTERNPALDKRAELLALLELVNDPTLSFDKILERYADRLPHLPEDASAPRNVTSLLTHLTLVGKVYRFLLNNYVDREMFQNQTVPWLDKEKTIRTAGQAETQRWEMTLATCRLRLPQQPVRVGDLNVFRRQELALEKIKSTLKDQILFYTNDTIWLMLPSSKQVAVEQEIQKALAPLYDREFWAEAREPGFWAETRRLEDVNLRVKHLQVRKLRWQRDRELLDDKQVLERSNYGQIAAKPFDPPLCTICQMRPALAQPWPLASQHPEIRARGGTPEDLCEVCLDIRDVEVEKRFTKLASWHPEDGRSSDIKTAWVKLTLDYDRLIDYLGAAYGGYLDSLRGRVPQENTLALEALEIARQEFNPLALMADFTEDFRRMTVAMYDRLTREQWEFESIREKEYRDFYVIRVENGASVLKFLRLYADVLQEYFPDALDPCPIRIAVNVSSTKYPFYEHWRWISAPKQAVNLQMPGIARVEIGAQEFFQFLNELNLTDKHDPQIRLTRTYLEKLRATEARTGRSRSLLNAVLLADIEARRIPRTLQPFVEMRRQGKISIQHILDWYKITTWGREP